jgi:hypothetical protein
MWWVVAAMLGHNGVVHVPGSSSSLLAGPSFVCDTCYTVFNYGMNYVDHHGDNARRRLNWNVDWFPLAVYTLPNGTVYGIADVGEGVRYVLGESIISPPPSCPPAETAKVYRFDGNAVLAFLETGVVHNIDMPSLACTHRVSWQEPKAWQSPWGGGVNTESPRFFAYAHFDNCHWMVVAKQCDVRLAAVGSGCSNEPRKLGDGCGVHSGGDLVVVDDRLLWAGGDGSNSETNVQRETSEVGKLIDARTGDILAAGFRHPWSVVPLSNDTVVFADTGGHTSDEISVVSNAELLSGTLNFGWPMIEGRSCNWLFPLLRRGQTHRRTFVYPVYTYDRRHGRWQFGIFLAAGLLVCVWVAWRERAAEGTRKVWLAIACISVVLPLCWSGFAATGISDGCSPVPSAGDSKDRVRDTFVLVPWVFLVVPLCVYRKAWLVWSALAVMVCVIVVAAAVIVAPWRLSVAGVLHLAVAVAGMGAIMYERWGVAHSNKYTAVVRTLF